MKLLKTVLAGALVAIATPVLAQQQLSIATGGTGGVYYPMGGGLAEVINNHIEGYAATAEVTGASVENMGLIATGDATGAPRTDLASGRGNSRTMVVECLLCNSIGVKWGFVWVWSLSIGKYPRKRGHLDLHHRHRMCRTPIF